MNWIEIEMKTYENWGSTAPLFDVQTLGSQAHAREKGEATLCPGARLCQWIDQHETSWKIE